MLTNQRKAIILRVLTHFYATPLTARDITLVFWDSLTDDERAQRVFETELHRFSLACARLSDRRRYKTTYLRAYRRRGKATRYVLTKKGDRVRRKIQHGSLPGWTGMAEMMPKRADASRA